MPASKLIEVTTVADDEIVLHVPARNENEAQVLVFSDLKPDTPIDVGIGEVRTLSKPGGELLATIATVNDVHLGEIECGVIGGLDLGPILRSNEGDLPYPEVMSLSVVNEIEKSNPDLVVAKGDLTSSGLQEEFDSFFKMYGGIFQNKLIAVRGNHDAKENSAIYSTGNPPVDLPFQERVLPGVTVALIDTTLPGSSGGRFTSEQAEWLDELAHRSHDPVLVFGHHHAWDPASRVRPQTYFGINPTDSEKLVNVFSNNANLRGYFAGHTHRNRVRRFSLTAEVPWVEVAAVKDFPGSWCQYRIYEGGFLQIHRRASSKEALKWSENCRSMYGGRYVDYAFGELEDRCFSF
ncbi:MAG: hypothetical protein HKL80_03665 [Acidimicrobiales bacterium]|nr:hypothetical protein [Acidimicrobiales bacterium]